MRAARQAGRAGRKRYPRGFALIATLTLLVLLALLASAMLAQVASVNRLSRHDVVVMQARQQALIGLDAAIAELQEAMGPDQRISASSAILNETEEEVPPHLLGVWNSWNAPLYGKNAEDRSIRDTYTPGRRAMFRRWLISCRDLKLTRDIDAAAQLSARNPGQRVCLLGEGTLGREAPRSHYVYADTMYMPLDQHTLGGFAWWVAGENQKAKLSIPAAGKTRSPVQALRRTWDAPPPIAAEYPELYADSADPGKASRLMSTGSLAVVGEGPPEAGVPYFADYTTASYSLLTNAAHGGLKQDLCLLLNKPSLEGTEFAPTSESDAPLVPDQWLPQRDVRFPIGSWQTMHAYYNCWPNASQKDEHVTTRLIGTVSEHHSRLGASVCDADLNYDSAKNGGAGTYFDSRSHQRGNEGAGYARAPVMLAYLCNISMAVEPLSAKESQLSLYYTPIFLWWNPYNVPMRIGGRRMWAVAAPFKTMSLDSYFSLGRYGGRQWSGFGLVRENETLNAGGLRKLSEGQGYMSCLDAGEYFQNSLQNAYADIVFRPGEVLVFTPGKKRIGSRGREDSHPAPGANPWVPGYRANTVASWHSPMSRTDSFSYQQARNILLGLRLGTFPNRLTDGALLAGGRSTCITVVNGFGGISSAPVAPHPLDPAVNDISSVRGKHLHSPQRFLMDWYNPDIPEGNRILVDPLFWMGGEEQTSAHAPYYVVSLGVVAKSANAAVDTKVYPGCDFRTKLWQHSSPAFWGAALHDADHQQRQYHPYQLAVLPLGGGMESSPVASVGRNGVLGITGGGEQVSFASVLELPVHPPFSLAGFAGMRLHPGWFRTPPGENAAGLAMQRMQYQSGVPGVGIGNSFADPCLPPDKVYISHSEKEKPLTLLNEFYDHALLINDALWDRWFCSSVSDMPGEDGKYVIPARYTLEQFLKGRNTLPVSRYVRAGSACSSKQALKRIMQGDGWKIIAAHLMVNGGFNVNSTSVAAWKAVLQGLASRQLVTAEGGKLRVVEPKKKPMNVTFSRFMLSTTDKSTDSVGGYSPMQGSESFRTDAQFGTAAWSEVRMLKPADIAKLAEEMVRQVKARGPFLSMSDFINRRLDEKGGDAALKGALQAAIDRTDINRDFREVQVTPQKGSLYRFPKAEQGDLHTAAPGYLIQSDVLASLGNILTVRDDTFTVRAYGCVRNEQGAVLSQCWCEATVQRSIDYVDPTDSPTAAEFSTNLKHTGSLSRINRVFGRRMRITSFKWLDCWDL